MLTLKNKANDNKDYVMYPSGQLLISSLHVVKKYIHFLTLPKLPWIFVSIKSLILCLYCGKILCKLSLLSSTIPP